MDKFDKSNLVDIATIKIDRSLSVEERKKSFLKQIKNPYCFLCEGVVVKAAFAENGKTLEDCLKDYIKSEML